MAFGRILLGGVAGGVAGRAMSDANTGTGAFHSAALGAMAGMGVGVGLTKQFWQGMAGAGRGAFRLRKTLQAAREARRGGAGSFEALSMGRYAARKTSTARHALGNLWGGAKASYGVARAGLKGAAAVTGFTMRHPAAAIGLTGAGLGAYGLAATSSPGASGMDINEAAAIARMHGGPSTGFAPGMGASAKQHQRAMFMDSTFGLTQGLHRGRHR